MKGQLAFCPESGAPLSPSSEYAPDSMPDRVVDGRPVPTSPHRPGYSERWSTSPDVEHGGLLTNGERVSSTRALLAFVRREHRSRNDDQEDPGFARAAASALHQLKSTDEKPWDIWVLLALEYRLRPEYETGWLRDLVDLRCPACAGPLKWEHSISRGVLPRCAGNCDGTNNYRQGEIRDHVLAAYRRAFGEPEEHREPLRVIEA